MDTLTAGDGLAGLELAEKENPDLIMLDVKMPGMDGWTVLSRLKADQRLSKIPVIVFTAGDGADSSAKALESGASAVCKKPFQPQELIDIIKDIV
jgi:CheY-like chemotaxis protein